MKRGILFTLFLCILVGIFLLGNKPSSHTDATEQQPTPTTIPQPSPKQKTIMLNKQLYAYDLIGPIKPSQITLISNLPAKQSSTTLKTDNACSELTSAGFYNTNDKHIGLFVIDDVVIQEQSQNNLFNSYVWATKDGSTGIGQLLPDEPLIFALQTGPLLIDTNQPRKLTLKVDEQARRLAVGVTTNSLLFYVVHAESNTFIGPTLVDLPVIIDAINTQEQLTVSDVVNLDGGNHSTFQSKTTIITELSPVGGIFCIK